MSPKVDAGATLHWVQNELSESLTRVRVLIERGMDAPEDTAPLKQAIVELQQVRGTARMVQCAGIAALADEMFAGLSDLLQKRITETEPAYAALLGSTVQLVDYVDVLAAGQSDSVLVFLPSINELRVARGKAVLAESDLFAQTMAATQAAPDAPDPDPAQSGTSQSQARKYLTVYQQSLLGWLKNQDTQLALGRLGKVAEQLASASRLGATHQLWRVVAAVVEGMLTRGLTEGPEVKRLLGRVGTVLKTLADQDEAAAVAVVGLLPWQLLFHLGRSTSQGPRVRAMRSAYQLERLLPPTADLEELRRKIRGPNTALLRKLSEEIRKDLAEVKDSVDLVVRAGSKAEPKLEDKVAKLKRMGDTLSMLGLEALQRVVQNQAQRLEGLKAAPEPGNPVWLEMATALLRVEHSLDDALKRQLQESYGGRMAPHALEGGVPQMDVRDSRNALMRELMRDLSKIETHLDPFLKNGDISGISDTLKILADVESGLQIMGEDRAAGLVALLARYVRSSNFAQVRSQRFQAERFADALACIEYFFEAQQRGQPGVNAIVDDLARYVEKLEIPADEEAVGDTSKFDKPLVEQPSTTADAQTAAEVETEATDPGDSAKMPADAVAPAAPPTETAPSPSEAAAPDVDPEIREIFVEEAGEVLTTLQDLLPKMRKDVGSVELLSDVRRAFHTLKGSGRMVGATTIGDFGWSFEFLLNQCRDGAVALDDAVFAMLDQGMAALPGLIAAFASAQPADAAVAPLIEAAHRAAKGQSQGPDPEITEIFCEDARGRLASVQAWLDGLDRNMHAHAINNGVVRALHTLRGSAALVDAKSISQVAGGLETYFEALRVAEMQVPTSAIAVFDLALPALAQWVEKVAAGDSREPDAKQVLQALSAASSELPAAAVAKATMGEHPQQAYALEAFDSLETLESVLQRWESQPQSADAAASVQGLLKQLGDDAEQSECVALSRAAEALRSRMAQIGANNEELHPAYFAACREVFEGMYQQLDAYRDSHLDADDAALAERALQLDAVHGFADRAEAQPTEEAEVLEGETLEAVDLPEPESEDGLSTEEILTEESQVLEAETLDAVDLPETEDELEAPTDAVAGAKPAEAAAPTEQDLIEVPPVVERGMDAETRKLFLGEVEDLLDALDRQFGAWERNPDAPEPLAELTRALHTLKVSARTADESSLHSVSHRMESVLLQVREGEIARDANTFARLHNAVDGMHAMLDIIRKGGEADVTDVIEELDGLQPVGVVTTEDAPAAVDDAPDGAEDGLDDELVETFSNEAAELLEEIETALTGWKADGAESTGMHQVSRALHTLKGSARMAGLMVMGNAAHDMESVVEQVDRGQLEVDGALFAGLQAQLEQMQRMHDRINRGDAASLVHSDQNTLEPEAPDPTPTPTPKASAKKGPTPAKVPAAKATPQPATTVEPSGASRWDEALFWQPPEDEDAASARRETARVGVEELDKMLNEAGEISIYRSRVEQHNSALQFQLQEVVETIRRIREQLRSMDIETEAQIAARGFSEEVAAPDGKYSEFDPLEMDRYSRMQELSRALSESVGDLGSLHHLMDDQLSESNTLLMQQGRVNSEVQSGLMGTLMVPFSRQTQRLQRVVKQVAQDAKRKAELTFEGVEQELDRKVLERMVAPLEHLLRNAVVHGIETPKERSKAGKDEVGQIRITLSREGSQLLIELRDDGKGLDYAAIRKTAISRKLMPASAELQDEEVARFIFEPGFSTAKKLTQAAGRGVGMDVVASEVKQLGGTLDLASVPGKGTRFLVRLPLTLSLSQALLVGVGAESYAVLLPSIESIVRIPRNQLDNYLSDDGPPFTYGGLDYRVRRLADYVDAPAAPGAEEGRTVPAVLVRLGEGLGGEERRAAVVVDDLQGNREIVSKAVGPQVSSVQGVSGATILPDGNVVLILDLPQLLVDRARREAVARAADLPVQEVVQDERPLVMVVDDSITIRRVTERLLDKNGFRAMPIKDGLEAIAALQTESPAVVLLDIEMPRADGFEVATFIRNNERLQKLPIIMITSRSGEKHRQRAKTLGVNRYLIKPFQEDRLIAEVHEMLQTFS